MMFLAHLTMRHLILACITSILFYICCHLIYFSCQNQLSSAFVDNEDNEVLRSAPDDLDIATRGYSHPGCPCIRFGYDLAALNKTRDLALRDRRSQPPWFLGRYPETFTSTCSHYSSQRGVGQKVLSYSYYVPTGVAREDSEGTKRFLKQMYPRARRIALVYPGWLMRVYHNVSTDDVLSTRYICKLFCDMTHVDLCHVKDLPTLGDLEARMPVGRTWRFSVLGDPTVSWFMSRDLDSKILDREVEAVRQWRRSGRGYHVMRDHPHHKAAVLAGLWGAHNKYPAKMAAARDAIFAAPVNLTEKYDQILLQQHLWPLMQGDLVEHDSYHCEDHPGSIPFPTQRQEWQYCGWGAYKAVERNVVFRTRCPKACRPKDHPRWIWC
ncbi:uncharacterized protein LOC125178840 [Hyalella azteca]|uniref:Uncharacterized protein LOC125178840 n=1 Tax=Hyalella azteca TaxID=294128 RepID=A0A979FQW1_HYAAZ|nr:uncharacterized protein LOC125178840 [Hyalella azteca]